MKAYKITLKDSSEQIVRGGHIFAALKSVGLNMSDITNYYQVA